MMLAVLKMERNKKNRTKPTTNPSIIRLIKMYRVELVHFSIFRSVRQKQPNQLWIVPLFGFNSERQIQSFDPAEPLKSFKSIMAWHRVHDSE